MVDFWNGQKTKFMKILLSPGVPYLQILIIIGHKCYFESLYWSWTTNRCNNLNKQQVELKLPGGGANRSLVIWSDLPVYIYLVDIFELLGLFFKIKAL